ncbi:FAD-binding oxidoreductase [Nonomuraea sp. LPB2021202275-12-8]|uniref:FAD-binding oxidoreductase n=1 Tax=Nonomuraea sp. LPB2021202275-12-8 TaxID=3120159 RepID=UPI00300D6AEF
MRDVGAHRPRAIAGVARPQTVAEVCAVVRCAAADGRRLYPLSTGRNWGMGSGVPATDENIVVDLGGMNRIRSLDLENGFAVVEPGVTQAQLAEELRETPWLLNVTASCADTSVVGNALERGDGSVRSRVHDVAGIEAVLPDGSVITTGGLDTWGRYRGRVAGPDLTGAFVQHNLGIVTAMAIALVPRPQSFGLVHARIPRDQIERAVSGMGAFLRRGNPAEGLLRVRELSLVPSRGDWTLPDGVDPDLFTILGPLLGSGETVRLAEELLRKALLEVEGAEALRVLDATAVMPDDPLYTRALMAQGIPTCRGVHNALGVSSCDQVDAGKMGFLALLPQLPMDVRSTENILQVLRAAAECNGTASMMEWNLVSRNLANGVIQIFFDRDVPDAPARAHRFRQDAGGLLRGYGCVIYRSDIDNSAADLYAQSSPGTLSMLHRLKGTFDPGGLLSPGRYSISA